MSCHAAVSGVYAERSPNGIDEVNRAHGWDAFSLSLGLLGGSTLVLDPK